MPDLRRRLDAAERAASPPGFVNIVVELSDPNAPPRPKPPGILVDLTRPRIHARP